MNETSIEVFLHGNGRPSVVTARLGETLKEVLQRAEALPVHGQFVFVGESDDALRQPDDEEDTCEPVDIDLTLEELSVDTRKHVHTRAAHRIEVTVHFNGQHHKRRFAPSTAIATVTAWAKGRFHIDAGAGADLVLAQRPGGEQPRPDVHLGELLSPGAHALDFDLVREITPQG
ncbi:hypothetical protein HFK87_23120 [Ralstonia pseudosolanacearum]|uniref:hypothetical protein n=1 Tax=Ralstonia pseudosolanacearum TaxID=1310165 RepID=UPI0020056492|nr:hypothetical protein [Ralstonia pseudosolanacearum]MCK4130361.1 hypothetical protein [Ralstonia pseudosolanacearum]